MTEGKERSPFSKGRERGILKGCPDNNLPSPLFHPKGHTRKEGKKKYWIPAYAGMTIKRRRIQVYS
jgi:hypothetical protein